MATPEEILNFADGGAVPAPLPSPIEAILANVPKAAGSYTPAAEALRAPINEGALGDPRINGEHLVGHVGLRNLLDEKLSDKIVRAAEKADDPALAGVAGLGHVEKTVNAHADLLEKRAKRVFSEEKEELPEKELSSEEHRKVLERINHLAGDPTALISGLTDATQALHAVAPQIAQSAQQAAARAVQFLASKAPQRDPEAMSAPYESSPTERAAFNRYLSVVENPTAALHEIKHGTLVPETTETLKAVYPRLYDSMKQSLISHIDPETSFRTKMMIGQFLGAPVDSSMSPARILSLQSSFAPPPPPPGSPAAKPPRKSLSKLSLADRTSLTPKDSD